MVELVVDMDLKGDLTLVDLEGNLVVELLELGEDLVAEPIWELGSQEGT